MLFEVSEELKRISLRIYFFTCNIFSSNRVHTNSMRGIRHDGDAEE